MKAPERRLAVTLDETELQELIRNAVADLVTAPSTAPPPEVLSRTEAAHLFRCSLATIDRLCRDDGLPHYRLGDCRRFLRSDLLAWLRAGSPSRRSPGGTSPNKPPA